MTAYRLGSLKGVVSSRCWHAATPKGYWVSVIEARVVP